MSQIKETNGGLRVMDIVLSNPTNHDGDPLTTVDFLTELEDRYFTYKGNKTFDTYMNLHLSLGKVLRSSPSIDKLLELQITNPYLSQAGWTFLLSSVKYLSKLTKEKNTFNEAKVVEELRMLVSPYCNLSSTRVIGDNLSVDLTMKELREKELKDTLNFIGDCDLSTTGELYTNLYTVPNLLKPFVRLLFVGDKE